VNIKGIKIFALCVFVALCAFNLFSQELAIKQEKTGPIGTNCYLLYDSKSKEAALIDIGGPLDILLQTIRKENLNLKYILVTHGHMDHLEGIPEIKKQFPAAQICITKTDYEDFLLSQDWCKNNVDKSEIAKRIYTTPELKKWFEYDLPNFIKSDISITDGQIFNLGEIKIQAILTPGHSRGSISYIVNGNLFSGDLLFIKGSGVQDTPGSSQSDFDKTIKELLEKMPDDTKVYPGHGKSFDFGTGKKESWWVKP
jgi:hydroxyacylglutathione hydrolase